MSRLRALGLSLRGVVDLVMDVRKGDHVVLSTLGPRAGLYAAAVRAKRPASVNVFDFLYSPRGANPAFRHLLRSCVDRFLVIRRGDTEMLERRFGVPASRTRFVSWALSDTGVLDIPTRDGEYLYAAGWAHRDWALLLEALRLNPVPAILAPGGPIPLENLPEGVQVQVIEMPSPEKGREYAANARLVAVLLTDCEYAAGPLVLLDALAMGKPVIATDANGNRDYIAHGVTGMVVPPADPQALSDSIQRLWNDEALRLRVGAHARTAAKELSPDRLWRDLLQSVLW